MYYLSIEESFSSAHQLKNYQGKCENLHGHNWRIILTVKGERLNDIGLLIDFHELKDILQSILQELDHTNLNALPYFKEQNPSSENIAAYLFEKIIICLKKNGHSQTSVESVTVYESATSSCTYKKE